MSTTERKTFETRREEIAKRKASIVALVQKYNELTLNEKTPAKDIKATQDALDKDLADYKVQANHLFYEECEASGDAMLEAVKRQDVVYLKTRDVTDKESKITKRIVEEKPTTVDLDAMHKYSLEVLKKDGIGKNKNWRNLLQKINFCLTLRVAKAIGVKDEVYKDLEGYYTINAIAKDIDLGKNPLSNTQVLKTLQRAVTDMIGEEYKATSHDVAYMQECISKRAGSGVIKAATHKEFYKILLDVCHHIVTGDPYGLKAKISKKN